MTLVDTRCLPHDPEIRKIWLRATKRPSSKHSDYISVCSDHFEDKYIKKCCIKTMLVSGAIPTLKLNDGGMDDSLTGCGVDEKSIEPNIDNRDIITDDRVNLQNEAATEFMNLKENDRSDDHNKNITTIEKSILNILNQLDIIADCDQNRTRSHSLKSDITRILLQYKVSIVEKTVDDDNITPNALDVKQEDSNQDDADFVANDDLSDSDCDLKTFQLRNEMKCKKDKTNIKRRKIKSKKSAKSVCETSSNHSNIEPIQSESVDVNEESDDSVYNLYPMAKNFLKKMQRIKAIRKQHRKQLSINRNEKVDKLNANLLSDGQTVVRHTCSDCDISFSSAHLLSLHPSFCKARLSKDIKLSYWAKKECPECNTKFSTKSNLRRHLIIHRLREYKLKMVEIHEQKDINAEVSMPNTNIMETSNIVDKSCLNIIPENKDKIDISEDTNRSDKKSTEEILFEDAKLNKVAISNILNTTHDDNSISLTFNVSSVNCVPPNSLEMADSLECTTCEEMCISKDELIKHSKIQHPDGMLPYVCNHCPNYFKTLSTLRMHVKTCHKEVSTTSGRNKYLAGKSEIANSYPKNIDFKVFACSRCAKIFLSAKDLTRHEKKANCSVSSQFKSDKMKLHRINSKYPCQFCGKIYKTYTGLKLHILDHTKELSYSCPKCPRRFKASFHLKKHMNNIHEKKYCICEICGAKYSNIYYLKRHLLVHNNIRNFKCNYCPKSFVYKSSLKSHIRVHTQEKPWVCQYCNQAFSERRNWRIHVNEHEGLKPFKCTMCEEAFVSKRKLNKHIHDQHN